jgi:hypothetical protein
MVLERVRESRSAWQGALTRGPGQHSAGVWFELGSNQFKNIQWFKNRLKIIQTLAATKGALPCSKNWK